MSLEGLSEKMAAQMNEGEHVRPAPMLLPIISLEGNIGIFRKKEVGENGYAKPTDIGQTFQGVIIAIRMQLSEFGKKIQRNSMEFDKSTDQVTIFEREGKGSKGKKVFTGYVGAAKEKYPELKEQRWLYMLVGGELVKVQIKGGSMGYWFKYLQELSKKKLHTFQVLTKFDPSSENNEELGKAYFACVPSISRELKQEELEEKVHPEFEKLHAQIATLKTFQSRPAKADGVDAPPLDEVPTVHMDEEEETPPGPEDF